MLFYNDNLYYSINSVLNVSTSTGTYTGNNTQTRTINVSNGKVLVLFNVSPNGEYAWSISSLAFAQYGVKSTVINYDTVVAYYITFSNNTILIENERNWTYFNASGSTYGWVIFA